MRRRGTPLAAIVAPLVLIASTTLGAAISDNNLPDQDVTNAIETEYLTDDAVESHLIDVTTNEGIVTLSGTVNNLLKKERAERIAETIKGVRGVVNRIEVRPITRSDTQVKRDIYSAIAADPATESYEVNVEVQDGIVTLSGEVNSWAERELTVEVAKAVKGVRKVDNQIDFEYTSNRPDAAIEKEVAERLESDVWVESDTVTVEVADGQVQLSGVVGSAFERRKAKWDAWVTGVRSVDVEDLEIQWWARDETQRKDMYPQRTDKEVESAVQDAFLYNPRVASYKITADAENGVLILTGTVDNLKAKRAAKEDAQNTLGVWRVKNLLRVRPTVARSDEEVAENVRSAFGRDPYVESLEILVNVINGKAYLYGDVNSECEKLRAKEVASGVRGVVDVDNHIDVEEPDEFQLTNDWEIKQDIESQLSWSPLVESEEVDVAVDDGVATLTGTVDSWTEYRMAQANAREAGARRVVNNLHVKYGPDYYTP